MTITYTWTGLAGDGLWATAGNWIPSAVPGTVDTDGDKVILTGSDDISLDSLGVLVLGGFDCSAFTGSLNTLSGNLAITIRYASGGVCLIPVAMTLGFGGAGNGLSLDLHNDDPVTINVAHSV